MRHTFPVHRIRWLIASVGAIALLNSTYGRASQTWQRAVDSGAMQAPDARIVVLDVASGRLLAAHNPGDAARTLAAPGSTLKPIVLYSLVSTGRWSPLHRIACNRQLLVAGHRLACSHPPAPPFDAREALTWSCNSYFAAMARSLHPGDLRDLLRPTGLLGATGLVHEEAVAEFREPVSVDDEQSPDRCRHDADSVRASLSCFLLRYSQEDNVFRSMFGASPPSDTAQWIEWKIANLPDQQLTIV
jgi:hypothetical protein